MNTNLSWGKSAAGQLDAVEVLVSVCESRKVFNSIVDIVARDSQGRISSFRAVDIAGTGESFCRPGDEDNPLNLIDRAERMFNRDGRAQLDERSEAIIPLMIDKQIHTTKIRLSDYLDVGCFKPRPMPYSPSYADKAGRHPATVFTCGIKH